MKYRTLIIKNGISGNSRILLKNGEYKPITKLKQSDILINKNGNQVNIKNITYKGKDKIINIYNEAWNDVTKITKNQMFHINENNNIIGPSSINWDLPKESNFIDNYIFGFTIGFLLWSGCVIDDDRIIFFLKKNNNIKEINNNLALVFGIQNVTCYEGSYLTKYIIKKDKIPMYIYETIKQKNIHEHLMIANEEYINGMLRGFNQSLIHNENILSLQPTYLNDLCNWININLMKENKESHFFIINNDEIEDVWDIQTDDIETSFIANNMIILY